MIHGENPEDDYRPSLLAQTEYEDCVLPRNDTDVAAQWTPPIAPVLELEGDPLDWPLEERPVIYVAGYFSANPMHGTANAVKAFDELKELGWVPLVPHASIVLDMLSPNTPEFWYTYDLALLRRCDAMYVCPDPLTLKSLGVIREIKYAKANDIPVFFDFVAAKDRYNR